MIDSAVLVMMLIFRATILMAVWLILPLLQYVHSNIGSDTKQHHFSRIETIVHENTMKGNREWWHSQGPKEPAIMGFANNFSYYPLESVMFKVSTLIPLASIKIQIYRLGYYNGDGARLVGVIYVPVTHVLTQATCVFESASRMSDCANWKTTASWQIPAGSISGVYVALPLSTQVTQQNINIELVGSYIPFVVLQPKKERKSDILFKTADATYVAYNQYGGWNVYRGNGSFSSNSRAYKASYNRPFNNRLAAPHGAFINFVFGAEYPMIYWLEKHGYDVSYAGCAAFEEMDQQQVLDSAHYKMIVSVGHDEYWSQDMKNAHYHARENGVNLAFFSGNEAYWRVVWDHQARVRTVPAATEADDTHNTTITKYSIHNDAPRSGNSKANTESSIAVATGTRLAALDVDANSHTDTDTDVPRHRVFLCAKESIDNVPAVATTGRNTAAAKKLQGAAAPAKGQSSYFSASYSLAVDGRRRAGGDHHDAWTGTFIDPRHREWYYILRLSTVSHCSHFVLLALLCSAVIV